VQKTIYLPDDLAKAVAKAVKANADLNVSEVCQKALRHELSRRQASADLERNMERHVFRAYGNASAIPGMHIPNGTSREVAFYATEIAGDTRATSQPWTAYRTKGGQTVLWDDNGGLMVFSKFADLRASIWGSRPDVVAEIAKALGEDYVTVLDI
jgi:post-segregation antitoxin (ccd killing protein)